MASDDDSGMIVVGAEWDEAELARHMRRLRRRRGHLLDDDGELHRFRHALLRSGAVIPGVLSSDSSGHHSESE